MNVVAGNVWANILAHEGEEFRLKRRETWRYRVQNGQLKPNRTDWVIPRSHIERACELWPIDGPGQIQNLMGPSYIYSLLADPRIV